VARISKQKDGEDGARFGFRLVPTLVEGVADEDGEPVSSCYVEPIDAPAKVSSKRRKLGAVEAIVEQAAIEVCGVVGHAPQEKVVEQAVRGLTTPEKGKRDQRRNNLTRALESRAANTFIGLRDGNVYCSMTLHDAPRSSGE
jgi:hypothetical protein